MLNSESIRLDILRLCPKICEFDDFRIDIVRCFLNTIISRHYLKPGGPPHCKAQDLTMGWATKTDQNRAM